MIIGIFRMVYYGVYTKILGKRTNKYSSNPLNPKLRILFVGDSMGVGVGASKPSKSLIGCFAQDFPGAAIQNLCINGSTVGKEYKQLLKQELGQYDAVIFMGGGMDILFHTPVFKLRKTLENLFSFLSRKTNRIYVMMPNQTGTMPIYIFPFSFIINMRARKITKLYKNLVIRHNLIPIYDNVDVLRIDQKKYYSKDNAHPNDLGYQLWYEKLKPVFSELRKIHDSKQ